MPTILPILATAAVTTWYAEYGLSAADTTRLTEAGCLRGEFHDGMTLTTCEPSNHAVTLGNLDPAALLCVVELRDHDQSARALELLDGAKPLFMAKTHIVLHNEETPEDIHDLCSASYWHEIADNVVYSATSPYIPQQPMPVSHPAVQKVFLNKAMLREDPLIRDIVDSYSSDDVNQYLEWLSTDYQKNNTKITRNSYSIRSGVGGCADSTWRCSHNVVDEVVAEINDIMKDYPFDWNVETVEFRNTMCPNIVVKIEGEVTPNEVVVIGAHMDSRNTGSGSTASGPAPGADDNGSGSAIQLAILKNMATNPHEFTYSVHLMWFCGEEQGLVGSDFMAKQYRANGVQVIGMFNNDMIGYTSPQHGMTLSFMGRNSEAWLSNSCKAFANVYVPDLKVGETQACCSDQQSFYAQGYPAAGIFETPTSSVVYPQYHRPGDAWDNGLINLQQVFLFGKANYACIMEYAVPLAEESYSAKE